MPNNAPVAQPLARNIDENTTILISAVFTDADTSDIHTFTIDTTGTLGSVTNNTDGTFTYDPNSQFEHLAAGETATDTFTYTVDDGNGGTSTETVSITITGQNDAPVAVAVAAAAHEDGPAITVTADFSDADASDSHTFIVDSTGTIGTVTNNNDGTFTYDPNGQFEHLASGETATDTFTYTVDDGNGGTSTETVTVTITGQNDAPVAVAVAAAAQEDGPAITVTADFSELDASDSHTFIVDSTGTVGAVTNNNDGTFTYDPNGQFEHLAAGETATDTFTYTVDDGNGGTSTETVTVTITGQNDAPVAVAVAAAAQEDGPAITVTADFSEVDASDSHTFIVDSTGTVGTVTNNNDGTFTYDPNGQFEHLAAGETATDTFTYTVEDGNGGTSTEIVTVTITGQNDAPVAVAVAAAAQEDGSAITVTADFSDVDASDSHTFIVDSTGTVGTVTNNNDGTFTYDPNGQFEHLAAGETATDTFTYTVDDGNGGTSTETVTVTITGQNDAPVAVAVAAAAQEDGPAITVTADFSEVDASDSHTFIVDSTGTVGTVTNNNDGTFTYDPNGQFEHLAAGETATDTFTYTVEDGNGGTSTEIVTVTITGQNDAPVAVAVAAAAQEDGSAITVTADFSDVDASDSHTFIVDSTGTVGTVTNNNDGTFTYDPNGQFEHLAAGETATDTFTYTVDDGNGGTSTESVTVTITGQNDAPVAVAVAAAAQEDGPAITVTADFTDVDASDSHTFIVDSTGTFGTVTNNNDGTFTYDPNGQFEHLASGETATDTFTYTVDDGNGGTSTETVSITITGQNDAPVAVAVAAAAQEDGPAITVTADFSEVDASDSHTFIVDSTGTVGTVTNNNDGTFTYDPNGQFEHLAAGETATDTFTYTVTDSSGVSATETVTVTITGQNDAPVALALAGTTDEDTTLVITASYSDVDGLDTHSFTVDTTGTLGNVDNHGDGTFSYHPLGAFDYLADGETATDSFSYAVSDGNGGISTETVTVTVTGTNDAPVALAVSGNADENGSAISIAADFSDAEPGDTHTITIDTTGTIGLVSHNGDGTFSYNPNSQFEYLAAGETTTDTFTYTVTDNHGASSTETVTVTITGQNDAPVSLAIATATDEDSQIVIAADFSDIDIADTHTFSVDTTGTLGNVSVNGDGTFTYDPRGAFDHLQVGDTATDTFAYTVDDGNGGTSTETITVTISGVNDAPDVDPLSATAEEDGPAVTVAASFADVDSSGPFTISIDTSGTLGQVTDNGDGTFTYHANGQFEHLNPGLTAKDTFTYTVTDEQGGSTTETVTITVEGQVEPNKLTASDAAAGKELGYVTAINDFGVVAAGVRIDSTTAPAAGAVYIYTPDGLGYSETKLVASDGANSDVFGRSLAINNNGVVAVGAYLDDDNGLNSGSIYVYTPTAGGGYSEVKLTASDGEASDQFGKRLSINDSGVIVAGAPDDGTTSGDLGAVYVYTPDGNGGYSETKLTASDGTGGNYFGFPANINDNGVIFVGASAYNAGTAGTAYLYSPDGQGGYTETKLNSPDPENGSYFGVSGAVNNNGTVVIGALGSDSAGMNSGAFYVYEPDGSGNYIIHKILPSDIAASDLVGREVAINDSGVIVVGADSDDDLGLNSGSAYVYVPDGSGGYAEFKLNAYDGSEYQYFGFSVSINNDGVVSVGGGELGGGTKEGAIYTFVPDENGDYVGADGTIYAPNTAPEVLRYGAFHEVSGTATAAKLEASDPVTAKEFGYATAVNDLGVVAVGVRLDSDKASGAGAIYIYTPDYDGYQETKLVASDGANSDVFGRSLAINNNGIVAVGAYLDDDNGLNSGSIYVYTPTAGGGYSEVKLTASDGEAGDQFGKRLSINDSGVIVAGAPDDGTASGDLGAVYVYTPDGNGGYSETKLTASDGTGGNYFGFPANINDNGVIFVGASAYNAGTAGTAYLYSPDGQGGYTETKLNSPDPENGSYFGVSGAVNNNGTVVIGALGSDSAGMNSGAFYVYEPDGSGNYIIHKILPSNIAASDLVGREVAINDSGVIVVGADSDDDLGLNSGSAYVYVPDGSGGYAEFKLNAYDGSEYQYFGFSVSINNDGMISVGGGEPGGNTNEGAVYTFVPDANGNYVGADGTVYSAIGAPTIQTYNVADGAVGPEDPTKFVASDGRAAANFGYATQINDGGVVVAGVRLDWDKAPAAGAVYIYTDDGNGGYQETKLVASDGQGSDVFGRSVAINKDGALAIGAYLDDDQGVNSGSVYVFTPTSGGGYSEVKLTASDGAAGDQFGIRVSINDAGVVVVGSPDSGSAAGDPGAAYVYTPDGTGGYSEVKLTASDGFAGDYFGFPTSINDNGVIFVGASAFYLGGAGAAYLYSPDGLGGYTELKLQAPDGHSYDRFGYSGAVNSSGTVVVSAFTANGSGGSSGAFYVYEPDANGSYIVSKILPTDNAAGDLAGRSIAINDAGVILVGAEADDDDGASSGSAYIYTPDGTGGYNEIKLTAHDGAMVDYFGYSVDINNSGTVTIGAYEDDDLGRNSGAVYTFTPDDNGNYVGPDGTVYTASAGPVNIQSFGTADLKLTGSDAANTLIGGDSDDHLDGQGGDDTLTGGTGSDTFVFVTGDTGHNTITDFTAGAASEDVIEIDSALFADFAGVLAAATDDGTHTVVTIDTNTSIELQNVLVSGLHQDDFTFS